MVINKEAAHGQHKRDIRDFKAKGIGLYYFEIWKRYRAITEPYAIGMLYRGYTHIHAHIHYRCISDVFQMY